jgi:transketolase
MWSSIVLKIPTILILMLWTLWCEYNVYKKRFEDTKWVIRSSKSKKDRQYNDQQEKKEKTNDGWKTRDYREKTISNTTKTQGELSGCAKMVSSSCSTSCTRRITVQRHEYYLILKTCLMCCIRKHIHIW